MYYRCYSCQQEKYVSGCLPGATCGLLLMVNMSVALGIALPIMKHLLRHFGGWAWLGFLPLTVGLFLAVTFIPEFLEWLGAMSAPCPNCHRRQWSWPFTRGFGL